MHFLAPAAVCGALLLVPAILTGQFTPIPAGMSCDSTNTAGGCEVWRVGPTTAHFYAELLEGKRVRLQGAMIAKCSDQTLYFTLDAARNLQREAGFRLFSRTPHLLNQLDSLAIVEVEGVFIGRYADDLQRYAGALMEVTVITHGREAVSVPAPENIPGPPQAEGSSALSRNRPK